MGRCIVVTSGKGGVGKTTVAATLGLTLAKLGSGVILVDADITLNNLDLVLGLENRVAYDINDVIRGKCRLSQALVTHPSADLRLLPSVRGADIPLRDFKSVVLSLREQSEYVLIDCPAGMDEGFKRAVSVATEALIVTTPSPSALRDADKVISVLNRLQLKNIALVPNRVRGDLILDGAMLSAKEISALLHIKTAGCLPEEDGALDLYGAVPGSGRFSQAIAMLARYVINGSGRIYDPTEDYRGVWGGIKRLLKKV